MSKRKLTEAERQALAKRRWDFVAGRKPAWRLTPREQQEAQRQYKCEQKGDYRHLAGIELRSKHWGFVDKDQINVFVMKDHIWLLQSLIMTLQEPSGQLLLDLVDRAASGGAPLHSGTLCQIKNELTRFYRGERPNSPKASKHRKLLAARQLQTYFECLAGKEPGDAEQEAAEAIGLAGLDPAGALRKRRERYRKRKPAPR